MQHDSGLIINTAALRDVAYDQSSNLLEIGGGTLNAYGLAFKANGFEVPKKKR